MDIANLPTPMEEASQEGVTMMYQLIMGDLAGGATVLKTEIDNSDHSVPPKFSDEPLNASHLEKFPNLAEALLNIINNDWA